MSQKSTKPILAIAIVHVRQRWRNGLYLHVILHVTQLAQWDGSTDGVNRARRNESAASFCGWSFSFLCNGRARKEAANQPCQQQPNLKQHRENTVRSSAIWSWSGGAYGRLHTSYHNEKLPVSFRSLDVSGLVTLKLCQFSLMGCWQMRLH